MTPARWRRVVATSAIGLCLAVTASRADEAPELEIAVPAPIFKDPQLQKMWALDAIAPFASGTVNYVVSMTAEPGQPLTNEASIEAPGMQPQVSNTIMGISYLMDHEKGIADVLKTVHPHPTLSEGVQECIRVLLGTSIYKPDIFPELIKVKSWHP